VKASAETHPSVLPFHPLDDWIRVQMERMEALEALEALKNPYWMLLGWAGGRSWRPRAALRHYPSGWFRLSFSY